MGGRGGGAGGGAKRLPARRPPVRESPRPISLFPFSRSALSAIYPILFLFKISSSSSCSWQLSLVCLFSRARGTLRRGGGRPTYCALLRRRRQCCRVQIQSVRVGQGHWHARRRRTEDSRREPQRPQNMGRGDTGYTPAMMSWHKC